MEEIAYCDAANRATIIAQVRSANPNVAVVWECFANDLEGANWNVQNRCDPEKYNVAGHININAYWATRYTYPEGVSPRRIFRISRKDNEAV